MNAPAFFLASRRVDDYPDVGFDLTIGTEANPSRLVESLQIATRILVAVVNDAGPDVRAVIFRRPQVLVAPAQDFLPRAAVELTLHAHDVCTGLRVPFEPPGELCYRLREYTRPWPMWGTAWTALDHSEDPWADLLLASGRTKAQGPVRSQIRRRVSGRPDRRSARELKRTATQDFDQPLPCTDRATCRPVSRDS